MYHAMQAIITHKCFHLFTFPHLQYTSSIAYVQHNFDNLLSFVENAIHLANYCYLCLYLYETEHFLPMQLECAKRRTKRQRRSKGDSMVRREDESMGRIELIVMFNLLPPDPLLPRPPLRHLHQLLLSPF